MSILEKYQDKVLEAYSNFPKGRYASIILVRKTESEVIFRTEGSGEKLSKELVRAGAKDGESIPRVVISKRKQVAVERRTGRELLRRNSLLFGKTEKEEDICALNRNNPCGRCIDCMLYGYAVGKGEEIGAQKSRVITDDAFSILPAYSITANKTFNALYENGTMRDPFTGKPSTGINEDEYVKPEAHFLDIETLKDVTLGEIKYVLGNILRSTRYGAISSRLGRVKNLMAGMIFSDCEIFSNLELTQRVYDLLQGDGGSDFPLKSQDVLEAVHQAIGELIRQVAGEITIVPQEEVEGIIKEIIELYGDASGVRSMLQEITSMYET